MGKRKLARKNGGTRVKEEMEDAGVDIYGIEGQRERARGVDGAGDRGESLHVAW